MSMVTAHYLLQVGKSLGPVVMCGDSKSLKLCLQLPAPDIFSHLFAVFFPKRLEIIDMLVCELCIATIITFGTRGTYYLYQSGILKSSNQGRMSWENANEPTCYVYVIGVFA